MKKSKSYSFLPTIVSKNIKRKQIKPITKLFVTTSDDLGFANKQIEKIEEIVKKDKENERKAWDKHILNNIYKSSGKSNYQALKEFSHRIKIKKNYDISKIDWAKQLYLNKKQVKQILTGNKISKRILESVEISKRLKDKKIYLHDFIFQTKNISLKNLKLKLIKNERENITKKENEYENALNYEKKSLENDIDKFDLYKIGTKQQIKNDETTLIKLNQKNKLLYEESKKLANEYKYIVEEIIRYITLIINYKTYASFVHKLIGEDTDNININLNEYINYKKWTEKDLNLYIKKALNELSTYLEKISLNEKMLDVLSDNNRLEILFQIMEDNILKVFEEKEKYEEEQKKIMEENMKIYNKFKYDIYLNELKDEKNKMKVVDIDHELVDYYSDMNFLLEDICTFILVVENKKKIKKSMSQTNITSNSNNLETNMEQYEYYYEKDVNKCFETLRDKQFYTQSLINEIETYKKEDPNLIRIITSDIRTSNRLLKRQKEKEKEVQKEDEKREKFIKKFQQNSIRRKYNFREPIPYHIIQERKKHIVKYKPESTSTNLLFY